MTLRQRHTEGALLYEKKLKPFLKSLNEGKGTFLLTAFSGLPESLLGWRGCGCDCFPFPCGVAMSRGKRALSQVTGALWDCSGRQGLQV